MERAVHVNPSILRKGDSDYIVSDPAKIKKELKDIPKRNPKTI